MADKFHQDRDQITDNLEAIQILLQQCVDEGMLDLEAHFHNELLDLLDEANLSKTYPELAEVASKAKTLEIDIDAWLGIHGRSTLGLTWPEKMS